jgi:hypothetical protein
MYDTDTDAHADQFAASHHGTYSLTYVISDSLGSDGYRHNAIDGHRQRQGLQGD